MGAREAAAGGLSQGTQLWQQCGVAGGWVLMGGGVGGSSRAHLHSTITFHEHSLVLSASKEGDWQI